MTAGERDGKTWPGGGGWRGMGAGGVGEEGALYMIHG